MKYYLNSQYEYIGLLEWKKYREKWIVTGKQVRSFRKFYCFSHPFYTIPHIIKARKRSRIGTESSFIENDDDDDYDYTRERHSVKKFKEWLFPKKIARTEMVSLFWEKRGRKTAIRIRGSGNRKLNSQFFPLFTLISAAHLNMSV